MKESVYYIASRSSIKEVKNMSINESSQDEDLKDELDTQFNIRLIAFRWIPKDSHQDVAVEDDHFGQWFVDSIIENEENIKNKGFVDELLFYRRVWGLARTATNKQNSDLDDDSNKENELMNVQLRNPQKVITKSRPKSVSHHNNETNRKNKNTMQELTTHRKRKRGLNLCSNCKKPGQNIARYPKKDIEQTSEEETEEEMK
ncbi:7383_t:CDS:2 [Racocetra persica]|uniref:7383_t:CDS:1 n=1 Tax=Racocetra persica TaxID=160502 RepID=A0ACA9QSK5_9GLOM|nr:7383_t:CDS:2 [Racocetra persica]